MRSHVFDGTLHMLVRRGVEPRLGVLGVDDADDLTGIDDRDGEFGSTDVVIDDVAGILEGVVDPFETAGLGDRTDDAGPILISIGFAISPRPTALGPKAARWTRTSRSRSTM